MISRDLLVVSDAWKAACPNASVGILAMRNVANPDHHPELERRKAQLESELQSKFAGLTRKELRDLPSLQPYTSYYSRYGKTYHVQLQLESVVFKRKSLAPMPALVAAMFMAELKNQLLTAGHDADAIAGELTLDVAGGDERYVLLNGQEQTAKPGDMMISDGMGIISSILYGPDLRTRLVPATCRVLFTVYGPPGTDQEALQRHLVDLESYVRLAAPKAVVEYRGGSYPTA